MSDGKRRRFRKIKQSDEKRPIILAKRNVEDETGSRRTEPEVQPKILLKPRSDRENKDDLDAASSVDATAQVPLKTIIVTRSEAAQSPALSGGSPTINRPEQQQPPPSVDAAATPVTQLIEPAPQMTRPATVISSTGVINTSARKLLMKANADFLVVGVIGMQGVGKSTIMNLLASDDRKYGKYDYYTKVFVEEDSVFPIKLKAHKCSARSRTESTHMFITTDRLILLDSPPVLCNSYKKDMTTNELDDLRQIICFMSVCHLLIVVQDDYCNMNFLRLLQFAELMKPNHDNKPLVSDYFPNVLFVKNRAKRQDYAPGQHERMNRMLKTFLKDSQLRIFFGQTAEQQRQKKTRVPETERLVNSFLIPEVTAMHEQCTYHKPLAEIIQEFRELVFMTPRNEMYAGNAELTEAIWFELLTKAAQDTQHFFFNTYEEIYRKHLEVGSCVSGGTGTNNVKDGHENWRE